MNIFGKSIFTAAIFSASVLCSGCAQSRMTVYDVTGGKETLINNKKLNATGDTLLIIQEDADPRKNALVSVSSVNQTLLDNLQQAIISAGKIAVVLMK